MKFYNLIFSLALVNTLLIGYEDSDIDGVDDSIDLCPDTSFDKLVDKMDALKMKLIGENGPYN